MPIFHTIFHLTCKITQNLFEFRSKILLQTVRVHKLLDGAKNDYHFMVNNDSQKYCRQV